MNEMYKYTMLFIFLFTLFQMWMNVLPIHVETKPLVLMASTASVVNAHQDLKELLVKSVRNTV